MFANCFILAEHICMKVIVFHSYFVTVYCFYYEERSEIYHNPYQHFITLIYQGHFQGQTIRGQVLKNQGQTISRSRRRWRRSRRLRWRCRFHHIYIYNVGSSQASVQGRHRVSVLASPWCSHKGLLLLFIMVSQHSIPDQGCYLLLQLLYHT